MQLKRLLFGFLNVRATSCEACHQSILAGIFD
jgi:hypothetical protein